MHYLRALGLVALVAGLMAIVGTETASATIIESSSGSQYLSGTTLELASEGTTTFHPPIGDIECKESTFGAKTTNNGGGLGEEVNANVETISFSGCNAEVVNPLKGIFRIAKKLAKWIIKSTNWQITFVFRGFHCVFSTNETEIGTLTGGSPATLDIEATLPRTGGRSGAFCGSSAQWTGSYKFTSPASLVPTE